MVGPTVEYHAGEITGEVSLLFQVQPVWNLWGVGIIGPGLFRRIGHRSSVSKRGDGFRQGGKCREGVGCETAGYKLV